ncbi:MAG: 4Fe-4S ferredoxin [Armatimonadota bacterium]|nr:MAG: 4Fe-4S ferredoxin [Armatimonadota bacterium]
MAVTTLRKIIRIDEEKCDGCGLCIPNCVEGALAIVDGKARLVSERYCDGLGACLGHCPKGAITIEEREAEEFDEAAVEKRLREQGISAADHAHSHAAQSPGAAQAAHSGCPGARMMDFREQAPRPAHDAHAPSTPSELRQWPVKINLVNPAAPYFQDAHLLIAADCAPFALASFHPDFLRGRAVVIGCPKFDDLGGYLKKLTAILEMNDIQSITVLHMEVPCCFGLVQAAKQAVLAAGKQVPVDVKMVGIRGEILEPIF